MATQLADALVTVNNDPVAIIPNSLMYTEGLGEQTIRATSAGGGQVEQVYANNVETKFSQCNFEMASTVENIARAREWKTLQNQNVVQIAGQTPEGRVTRTFTQAAILNDYEVPLGSETNITVEFKSNQAI
jgi:hypothetical protein